MGNNTFLKINKVNVPLLYRHGGIHKTKKDKTHSQIVTNSKKAKFSRKKTKNMPLKKGDIRHSRLWRFQQTG